MYNPTVTSSTRDVGCSMIYPHCSLFTVTVLSAFSSECVQLTSLTALFSQHKCAQATYSTGVTVSP